MSIIVAALLLAAPADVEPRQPVNVTFFCDVIDAKRKQREFSVTFSVMDEKWTQIGDVEINDGDVVSKQIYDNSTSVLGRPFVKIQLPKKTANDPKLTQERLYQFDFTDDSFGHGIVVIKRFSESNANSRIPRTTEATGMCAISIPRAKL
jgi:hypothetical protein